MEPQMDTDSRESRGMDTDGGPYMLEAETREIIGCAMEVLNTLGHGLLEKPYENALVVEFGLRSIPCRQQPQYDVIYKNVRVGQYMPDLIVFDQVVVDTKVIENIGDYEIGQMLNYLKITGLHVGLIVNAWEAIGEGEGEIRVSLRIVDATETSSPHVFPADWKPEKDTYACLEVSDTACGIDPEQLDLIFDPFFSTRFTGRGLGLAVVLGTVRSYGGAIAVASEPGRGSIFQVFWTIAEPEAQTVHKAETDVSKPIEGLRLVLFVDDEAQLRNMAELMLGHLGFSMIQAGHGLEALEIFRARKDEISLVILDLTMPGMNGWETLEALRALRHDIPVILASGYDEAKAMEGKHAELPQAFLHKPYRMVELKAALGAAMAASSAEDIKCD